LFVVSGRLFRSDELSALTPSDWKYLQTVKLTDVCDLRRPDEILGYETRPPFDVRLHRWEYSEAALDDMIKMAEVIRKALAPLANMNEEQLQKWVESQYERYASGFLGCKIHLKGVFDVLCGDPEPQSIIVHCSAGKDRTGYAATLILSALGVDRELILEDYMRTNDFYAKKPADVVRLQPLLKRHGLDELNSRVMNALTKAYRPAMELALKSLDEKYGSPVGFITKELGVTEAKLDLLRQRFLQKK